MGYKPDGATFADAEADHNENHKVVACTILCLLVERGGRSESMQGEVHAITVNTKAH